MIRTYTLTPEEYKKELQRASLSQYRVLIEAAKQVSDSEVRLTIETEGKSNV